MLAYDMRDSLTPRRVTNAMWDFSWLYGHYEGGPFADFDRATDELAERGFNTVRIETFPLIIGKLDSEGQKVTIPGDPLRNWGPSDIDREHAIAQELVEFMTQVKNKGLHAILSTWNPTCNEFPDMRIDYAENRDAFRAAWKRTLDILGSHDLLEPVLFVDLDQEFPFFSPYAEALQQAGQPQARADAGGGNLAGAMEAAGQTPQQALRPYAWTQAQMLFVRQLMTDMLSYFQWEFPGLRFTYSLTAFWKEVRALDLQQMDVLELHTWIHQPRFDVRSGFNKLTKDRGEHDYADYQRRIDATMKALRPMLLGTMHNKMALAQEWSREAAAPVVTTESWGPWWHMDHPDLTWRWLREWCAECMQLAARYGFWGVTPWNYAHPYWENWKDVSWYQEVNGAFLRS